VSRRYIVDTGPLVAILSERDRHHEWATHVLASVTGAALTCEPVLTEAWHILGPHPLRRAALLDLVASGALSVVFDLEGEIVSVKRLAARYRDRPMSLADACLVRMAELNDDAQVITLDSDFSIYRKHGRQTIPAIAPDRSQ
jgi:uncharacterized protein